MPEIDKIKSRIDVLRDDYRNIFYIFFAVMGGSFAIIYKILVSKEPVYLIFLAVFGFITSVILFSKMLFIREDITKLQNRLEELP